MDSPLTKVTFNTNFKNPEEEAYFSTQTRELLQGAGRIILKEDYDEEMRYTVWVEREADYPLPQDSDWFYTNTGTYQDIAYPIYRVTGQA